MSSKAAGRSHQAARITIKTRVNKLANQREAYDQRQYDGSDRGGDQDPNSITGGS